MKEPDNITEQIFDQVVLELNDRRKEVVLVNLQKLFLCSSEDKVAGIFQSITQSYLKEMDDCQCRFFL